MKKNWNAAKYCRWLWRIIIVKENCDFIWKFSMYNVNMLQFWIKSNKKLFKDMWCFIVVFEMLDFKNSMCQPIQTWTLSYDMSIVDLTANISQWENVLYHNCIRINGNNWWPVKTVVSICKYCVTSYMNYDSITKDSRHLIVIVHQMS